MQTSRLQEDLNEFKNNLQDHPVFTALKGLPELRVFCSYHVFLVWDYMSLLKSLQFDLTYARVPWVPLHAPYTRFLINSMVLKEESDIGADGEYASYYEMYRQAVVNMKGDVTLIDDFIKHIQSSLTVFQAIDLSKVPNPLKEFLEYTFWVVEKASLHEKAAVVCFGREGFGHHLLLNIVQQLETTDGENLESLCYFLKKKTAVNDQFHAEISKNLLQELCGSDEVKWKEAKNAASQALRNRLRLFRFIHEQVVRINN